MEAIQNLQGILKADFQTVFDMKSIEQKTIKTRRILAPYRYIILNMTVMNLGNK